MEAVLFFLAALGALGGAIGVVALRNPFYGVLALIVHLFSLAVLFLLLSAAFVAAAQVVVYAGAVMVLYVFVVAYVGGDDRVRLGADSWPALSGPADGRSPLRGALDRGAWLLADGARDHGPDVSPASATLQASASFSSNASCWPSRPRPSSCSSQQWEQWSLRRVVVQRGPWGGPQNARQEPRLSVLRTPHGPLPRSHRMNIEWYIVLSSLLFAVGAMGILIRRSPVVILLCLELMLNAGNLSLVAFSRMVGNQQGQIFAIVVMVVAACEVVVGLGLIVAIFRRKLPLDVDELRELRG